MTGYRKKFAKQMSYDILYIGHILFLMEAGK